MAGITRTAHSHPMPCWNGYAPRMKARSSGGSLAVDAELCHEFHEADTAAQRFELALPHHVQTTTQRWFADPLLGRAVDGSRGDRTLGTVFTHDHFAPSSIQQHGFYSALLRGTCWKPMAAPGRIGNAA